MMKFDRQTAIFYRMNFNDCFKCKDFFDNDKN